MTRKTLRMLLVALVTILSFASAAEAGAPKKALRHRPKHSSRVASASNSVPKGAAKPTARKKNAAAPAAKSASPKTATPLKKKPTPSTKPR